MTSNVPIRLDMCQLNENVFITQHFYLNCSTLFCSEFQSWRKDIQWWCLSLEAYVTESSEFQSFIQAVDSTGRLCSSVSFFLWKRRTVRTRLLVQGEIAFFPLLEYNFSLSLHSFSDLLARLCLAAPALVLIQVEVRKIKRSEERQRGWALSYLRHDFCCCFFPLPLS